MGRIVAIGLAVAGMVGPAAAQDRFDIAITVDDLPGHGALPVGASREGIARAYIAALKAHGVREAFGFVNAAKTQSEAGSEAVLTLWRKAGYPLGNHAWSHMNLNRAVSLAAWETDVTEGEPMVARHMRGREWRYFRYPNLAAGEGERGVAALAFLKRRGYRIAHVSAAFSDWSYTDAYNRCLAKGDRAAIARMKADYLRVVDEGIARMKAASQRLYGRQTAQVLLTHLGGWQVLTLPDVLARLDAAGARYVPLAQAQADPAFAQAEQVPGGGGTIERVARARGIDLSDLPSARVSAEVEGLCRS